MNAELNPCPACSAPMRADQRYCINCGHAQVSSLAGIRTILGAAKAAAIAPVAHTRTRLQKAGRLGGMTLAGLGLGILFGALVNPSSGILATPLVLVRLFSPAAANVSHVSAAVSAGAPEAGASAASGAGGGGAAQGPAAAQPAPSVDNSSLPPVDTTGSGTATDTTTSTTTTTPAPKALKLPKIKHVWLIVLADQPYNSLYGKGSPATYLNKTLVPQGTLLKSYHASAHDTLSNGIALISGQGPTPEIQSNCPTYQTLKPGTADSNGLARGRGCVFGTAINTLPGQLTANLLKWRAYIGGLGAPPAPTPSASTTTTTPAVPPDQSTQSAATCRHPQLDTGDPTSGPTPPADGYVMRRNPFVYFEGITGSLDCAQNDVGLSQLTPDLQNPDQPQPAVSWIFPDLCQAGASGGACPSAGQPSGVGGVACGLVGSTCPGPSGAQPTGPAAVDLFLQTWIPKIQATKDYQKSGMIVIVSDQAPASGPGADSTACCGKIKYANTSNAGGGGKPGPGGGLTGALVISPFASKGAADPTAADHFTVLRTIEDLFNIPSLGYAAHRKPFDELVFPGESGGSSSGSVST